MSSLFSTTGAAGSEYERVRQRVSEVVGARERLDSMWLEYLPFADPNFEGEFVLHPLERFWEMQLTVSLMRTGFDVIPTDVHGPDVRLQQAGGTAWIEATAPSSGTGPDAIPVPPQNAMFDYPERQIILRLRTAIESKFDQLSRYVSAGLVAVDEPYIIAVSGGRFHTLNDFETSPAILKAVLPIGAPQIRIHRSSGDVVDSGMEFRPVVQKESGAGVQTNCFLDERYAGVSAVLFSEANFLLDPEQARDGFLVIHNPFATNPLPLGWLGFGRECLPVIVGDTVTFEIRDVAVSEVGLTSAST